MHFMIEYVSIMYMLVKVYIIIQNEKVIQLNLFSYFYFYRIRVCYKSLTNIFIRYQYFYLIEKLNSMLWYIVCKDCIPNNC